MSAPTLSLAGAARACGVSQNTIRRRREALEALGVTVTRKGWSIPVPALVTAGLMPNVTPAVTPSKASVSPPTEAPRVTPETAVVASLRADLADAERRAVVAEQRAAVAEAVARERAEVIEAQRVTIRLIEASTEKAGLSEPAGEPAPARRGWFRRR